MASTKEMAVVEKPTFDASLEQIEDKAPSAPAAPPQFGLAQWKTNLRAFGKHKRVSFWCIAVLMLLVNFGFDTLIAGQALAFHQFRVDYGRYYAPTDDYVVDALWQSLWAAANTLGIVIGSFIAGFTNDYFILLFAPNVQALFAAKLIFGVAIGLAYTTAPLYVIENAPTEVRGTLMSLFNTFVVLGQFLAVIVANPLSQVQGSWSYRGTFVLTFLVPLLLLFVLPFLPESPIWYIMKDRENDARRAITKLHGISQPELIDEKYIELRQALDASNSAQEEQKVASWLDIFRGGNLRRTILMTVIYALHHCSGMPFVLSYQAYFFQLSGVGNAFAITLGSFGLMLFGNLGALILPDFVGQRKIMVYGAAFLILWDIIIAAAGFAGTDNRAAVTASVAFVASWAYFYQLTIGTIGFVVAPEIPSQLLRAKTQSFGTIVANVIGWAIAFSIPYLFNPDQANLGARLLIIFAGLAAPLTIYLWIYLPETKNRSLKEVEEVYRQQGRESK